MGATGADAPFRMDESACCDALGLLDREVMVLSVMGDVLFANQDARALIDAPMGEDGPLGSFPSFWEEGAEAVRGVVRRLAGTSTWQPVTLTRASGRHAGLRMNLRGRAFLTGREDGRAVHVLVTADSHRERSFEDHRRLIRHLNTRVVEGSQTESLLSNLLENERRLKQELVHRTKNNLSLLMSLIGFNKDQVQGGEARSQLDEIQRRILSIAAVHDILDRQGETDFVRADQLIERICQELERALVPGAIQIQRRLMPVRLHVNEATPLALIINELVTNALKHAFPAGGPGRVSIDLKKNGIEKLEAVVEDDGVGLPSDLKERNSTGATILGALAQQLGGSLTQENGQGTTWRLIFAPKDQEGLRLVS